MQWQLWWTGPLSDSFWWSLQCWHYWVSCHEPPYFPTLSGIQRWRHLHHRLNPPLGKAPSLQLHLPCCPVLPMFAPCRPSLQAPSQAATTAYSGTSTRAIRAFGALGAFQGARWCAEEARGRAGLRAWGRRAGRRREPGWGTTHQTTTGGGEGGAYLCLPVSSCHRWGTPSVAPPICHRWDVVCLKLCNMDSMWQNLSTNSNNEWFIESLTEEEENAFESL